VPIYVSDAIMERASITPDQEVETEPPPTAEVQPGDERLSIFKDFVDTLDFDENNEDPDDKKSGKQQ